MFRTFVTGAMVASFVVASTVLPVPAQTANDAAALRKDIEALKEGQAALLRELQQIKALLAAGAQGGRAAAAAPAPEVVLTVGDAPSKGKKDARLTLVEFTDYQ